MVTIDRIKRVIKRIERKKHDSEIAHFIEDELLIRVLEHIASGNCQGPQQYADAVLEVQNIEYDRHYA